MSCRGTRIKNIQVLRQRFFKILVLSLNLWVNYPSICKKIKHMKKTGIFLAFIFISFLSFAQVQRIVAPKQVDSTGHQPAINDGRNDKIGRKQMMRELELSKDQRSKLKEIRQSNKVKKDEISNDDKLTTEQKDAKLRELQREQAQSTMTILNDEQKAKIKTMRQEMRRKRQQNQNN